MAQEIPYSCNMSGSPQQLLRLALPSTVEVPDVDEDLTPDRGWNVVVWNDPVNLMTYVVYILRKLFGYNEEKATELMLQVHNNGRAIVATEPLEKAEFECFRLHRHGLWATMEEA